jgi:WD40 repeat protein
MKHVASIDCGTAIEKIRFHPRRPLVATVAAEKDEIRVWDLERVHAPVLVTRISQGDSRPPGDIGWHPHEGVLAIVRGSAAPGLCDATTGAQIRRMQTPPLPGWTDDYFGFDAVAFSGDGNLLAVSRTFADLTEVYDVDTGTRRTTFWNSNTSLALHPEEQILATLANDQGATFTRFAGFGDELRAYDLAVTHNIDGYTRVLFNPPGDMFAIPWGWLDMTVYLHEFPSLKLNWVGSTEKYEDVKHLGPSSERLEPELFWNRAGRVAFTPDGKSLLLAGLEGRVIELPCDASEPSNAWQAHDEPISAIEVGYRHRLLATAGFSGEVRLWPLPHPVVEPDVDSRPLTSAFLKAAREIDLTAPEDELRFTDGERWYDADSWSEGEVDETAPPWVQIQQHLARFDREEERGGPA